MELRKCGLSATLLSVAAALGFGFLLTPSAPAQTYTVVYNFDGGADGAHPLAGLTMDSSGNLYGTTADYSTFGWGSVYEISQSGSGWGLSTLYAFQGLNNNIVDGSSPASRAVLGPNGTLYGTTRSGGFGQGCMEWYFGCGTVYSLRNDSGIWIESLLFQFGNSDGGNPGYGDLVFDQAANLYDTSFSSAPSGDGDVYELRTTTWRESVLHTFQGIPDGSGPASGPLLDPAGNLYGTTSAGGAYGYGSVYQLTASGSGWSEVVLYSFTNGSDGGAPASNLLVDRAGNIYGATQTGGTYGGGTVFRLWRSPVGAWRLNTIYQFRAATMVATSGPLSDGCTGQPFTGSNRTLTIDSAGNLYGTTSADTVHPWGSIFKLSPVSATAWFYTTLHDFSGTPDGAVPWGSLLLDGAGNLYGTTALGGTNNCGVVFKITP